MAEGPETWQLTGALGLPSVTRRQVRIEERLGPGGSKVGPGGLLGGVSDLLGEGLVADRFEVHWRAAGLRRPGAIVQLTWPRLSTRLALAMEPPLAHALVDRLLGFERLPAEGRLQVTPVEWGILSFVAARALDRLDETPGPFGPWDLAIDRVGPDPFDPTGLGPVATWRWRVRIGDVAASVRLWIPESLLALWLLDDPPGPGEPPPAAKDPEASSLWKAEAGKILLPKGLEKLRPGSLLLIDGSPLSGTPDSPEGPVDLVPDDPNSPAWFRARTLPESKPLRLVLESFLDVEPRISKVPVPPEAALTVELGRINLPLAGLADLKPGDVLDLGRQPRDPVELTSGGRPIARGELVQVDTELGVRVTQLFV